MKLYLLSALVFVIGSSYPVVPDKTTGTHGVYDEGPVVDDDSNYLTSDILSFIKDRHLTAEPVRVLLHSLQASFKYLLSNGPGSSWLLLRMNTAEHQDKTKEKTFKKDELPIKDLAQQPAAEDNIGNVGKERTSVTQRPDVDNERTSVIEWTDVDSNERESSSNVDVGTEDDNKMEFEVAVVFNRSNIGDVQGKDSTGEKGLESISACRHIHDYFEHRWLRVIVACPKHWENETTRKNCKDWDDTLAERFIDKIAMLPVQDGLGTVYGNVFCAICHQAYPIYPWEKSLNCKIPAVKALTLFSLKTPNPSFLQELDNTQDCDHLILPSIPDAIQSCRNHDLRKEVGVARHFHSVVTRRELPPISFSFLFNFDFKGETHLLYSATQEIVRAAFSSPGTRCNTGETFDAYIQKCRLVRCNNHYRLEGDICVPDETVMEQASQRVNVFNLPDFNEMAAVSLSTNITVGTYTFLLSKEMDELAQICVEQIAGQLNISINRFKNVNISFDFDSNTETRVEIHPVDKIQPRKRLDLLDITTTRPMEEYEDADSSSSKEGDKNITENSTLNHFKTAFLNIFSSSTDTSGEKYAMCEECYIDPTKDISTNDDSNDIRRTSQNKDNTKRAKKDLKDSESESLSDISARSESSKTGGRGHSGQKRNQKQLHGIGKHLLDTDFDFERPMTMHISFIIVPPKHPQDYDMRTLVAKMSHLITKKELSISVSGRELTLTEVSDNSEQKKDNAKQFCEYGILGWLDGDEIEWRTRNGHQYLYARKWNTYFKPGQYDTYALVRGTTSKNAANNLRFTSVKEFTFVCFMPRIHDRDCRRFLLTADEYEIDKRNKSITFEEKSYDFTMYTIVNVSTGLVEICVPTLHKMYHPLVPNIILNDICRRDYATVFKVEDYLTKILGRVSTAALALVFITYCLFPSLRNMPGCNLMNLTIALFVAELVFVESVLVQDDSHCIAVTILLHFFFLVAHFWMNVMSFDVYRTFSKRGVSSRDSSNKRLLLKYVVYAWGVPLIIVGTCVFIEFSDLFDIQIGYKIVRKPTRIFSSPWNDTEINSSNTSFRQHEGTRHIDRNVTIQDPINHGYSNACWIQSPLVALIAFGVPILIIFLTNCLFFICTIISVSRTVKLTRQNLNRQVSVSSIGSTAGRSEVMLYLRMSSVMGITWIFGFSSAIISSVFKTVTHTLCSVIHVHSVLFILFNISQGIFIFVSFVCNRRVMQLYTRLYIRLKRFIRKSQKSRIYSIGSNTQIKDTNSASSRSQARDIN